MCAGGRVFIVLADEPDPAVGGGDRSFLQSLGNQLWIQTPHYHPTPNLKPHTPNPKAPTSNSKTQTPKHKAQTGGWVFGLLADGPDPSEGDGNAGAGGGIC